MSISFIPQPGKKAVSNFVPFFRPTDIGDLAVWLDASDSSTLNLNINNLVLSWTDKVAGRQFQGDSYPQYSSTGFNSSYPTVSFATQVLTSATRFSFTSTDACCIFFVGNLDAMKANSPLLSGSATSNGTDYYLQVGTDNVTSGWYGDFDMATNGPVTNAADAFSASVGCFNLKAGATAQDPLSINGVQGNGSTRDGTYSLNASWLLTLAGMDTIDGKVYYNGNISEILIYSKSLPLHVQQFITAYLGQKWGLTSVLPPPFNVQKIYYNPPKGPTISFVNR